MIEQAGDTGGLDAGEIVEHAVLAFRREQFRQIAVRKFLAVIAEQRFGAAIAELMLPSASNITMPSAVVSRMAPSSSALAWPTGDGSRPARAAATGSATRRRRRAPRLARVEKIKASAESPSHEIV